VGRGIHEQGWERKYESTCLNCLRPYRHAKKPGQAKYCSLHCGDNFRYSMNRKRPKTTSNCANCGKEFEHVMRVAISCSPRCRSKLRFDKMKLKRFNI